MFPRIRRKYLDKLELDIPLPLNFSGDVPLPSPSPLLLLQTDGLFKKSFEESLIAGADLYTTDVHNELDLERDINSKLVETTVKFFLFQRGQVPIPYDKIQKRDKVVKRSGTECPRNVENKADVEVRGSINVGENDTVADDLLPPHERIRIRKLKRKQFLDKRKADNKFNKILQTEENILKVLEPMFEILQKICALGTSHNSSIRRTSDAVVLMFGASILNPKEIIIIEFEKQQKQIESILEKIPTSEDIIIITRSFYKSLIMSTAFTEFTEKRLRSTHSHICFLSTQPVSDDLLRSTNITLLENINILKSVICPEQSSRKPILHIRLNFQSQHLLTSNNVKSVFEENTSDHFYYQLPLRFKGVSIL